MLVNVVSLVALIDQKDTCVVVLVPNASANNLVDFPESRYFVPVVAYDFQGRDLLACLTRMFQKTIVQILLFEIHARIINQQVWNADH